MTISLWHQRKRNVFFRLKLSQLVIYIPKIPAFSINNLLIHVFSVGSRFFLPNLPICFNLLHLKLSHKPTFLSYYYPSHLSTSTEDLEKAVYQKHNVVKWEENNFQSQKERVGEQKCVYSLYFYQKERNRLMYRMIGIWLLPQLLHINCASEGHRYPLTVKVSGLFLFLIQLALSAAFYTAWFPLSSRNSPLIFHIFGFLLISLTILFN